MPSTRYIRNLNIISVFIFLFPLVLSGQSDNYSVTKTGFSKKNFHEFSPAYYKNGLVFTTNRQKGLFSYSTSENSGLLNIYFADTLNKTGKHKARYFSGELNSIMNDGPVTFNPGMDTVYFTRNRLVDGKIHELSSPWNKLGIFIAINEGGKWKNIREFRFNNEWYNLSTPFLSPDGRRLYFASDMPNGFGGSDIYYSEWKNGFWDTPVNLGPVINTSGNESYPFFNSSGEFYFASDGHPGLGGKDIFYSRFENSAWKKPVGLNPPVNSDSDDFGLITDNLMNSGYFSSNRDKSIDIFYFHTLFPQVFYDNYQKEISYCYVFKDDRIIAYDSTLLQFTWQFDDSITEKGSRIVHCFPGPGEYKIQADLVDKTNGKLFFRVGESVLTTYKIEQPYILSPDVVLLDKEIEFSGMKSHLSDYIILDYAWDFGDNGRAHGETVLHSFEEEGDYNVNLFLILKSVETGKISKKSVTKKVKVVKNLLEKEYRLTEAELQDRNYPTYELGENTRLTSLYSAQEDLRQDAVYCIVLMTSPEKLARNSRAFRNLPDKYIIKERYDEKEMLYYYTVERQLKLMSLYPSFREITNLGFRDARVRIFPLTDQAEKELFSILQTYETFIDKYFDKNERLTTDAYIMLDQIYKFMMKYPQIALEVGVHTDNLGNSNSNLIISKRRADMLTDYLINRGIDKMRLSGRGYGEIKPLSSNIGEENRKNNRRVEFILFD